METHGIHTEAGRKEITCADCGHVYLVANGERSGLCSACGNVALLIAATPTRGLGALSEEIAAKRVLPRLRGPELALDPLEAFRSTPSGARVEELRIQYQVDWQLWAALVKNFSDPAYHMAYLCSAIAAGTLERAAAHYREHRSVMVILADSRWQAEIADLMLARVEAISLSQMPNQRVNHEFDIPTFLKALPSDSRVLKVGWFAIGMFLLAKFLHLSPL